MVKRHKILATLLSTSLVFGGATPVSLAADTDISTSVSTEDDSTTTVITVTEEISEEKEDGTVVEGIIVKTNTETTNAEGQVTATSLSEEGKISETTEKPYDSDNDDVTVDLVEESEVTKTGSVTEPTTETEYDSELDADVTTTVTETPREVTTTTDRVEVTYDNEADAYEGKEDLEFMTPVWDGTQKNLGGGTLDWFPGNSMEVKPEGYDYTPYGFMHNDVTHMLYVKTDKDGNMVDIDGNPVYFYDEETESYSRKLTDKVNIYDIAYKKGLFSYKKVAEDGSEYFEAVKDEASVDKIVNFANSMMCAFYDKSQTHSDELWDAVEDDLFNTGQLLEKSSDKKAEYDKYVAERKAYDESTYTPAKKANDEAKKANDAAKKAYDAAKKELKNAKTEEAKAIAQEAVDRTKKEYDDAAKVYSEKNALYKEYLAVRNEIIAKYNAANAEKSAYDKEITAICKSIKEKYPEFLKIADISRLSADYDDDGLVTQETKYIYNGMFELFQKEISGMTFTAPENIIPAYCVDVNTGTIRGSWYDLMNVEDVGYYSTERTEENGYVSDADRIKAIAVNGYWGTKEGKGSLENMRAFFQEKLDAAIAAGETLPYTQEDVDGLTHGCALSITQHSLWRFGNSLDGAYMDEYTYAYSDQAGRNARIDRFIEYFTTMPIDTSEFDESAIFTQEKFVDSMKVTVSDRVADHANNQDDDQDNDVYNVDFNFSLVVTPGEGDDLVVSIVDSDGNIIAKARLAGSSENDDETFTGNLVNDGNGNYKFTGLKLIENSNQKFSLNLEGAQYLEEGVYLFKSANGEEYSQTYATLAKGAKTVDLAVDVDFSFNVKEGTVTETRTWVKAEYEEFGNGGNNYDPVITPNTPNRVMPRTGRNYRSSDNLLTLEDELVPLAASPVGDLIEIEDEEVPLADAPKTGSLAGLGFMLASIGSGFGLWAVEKSDKKEKK